MNTPATTTKPSTSATTSTNLQVCWTTVQFVCEGKSYIHVVWLIVQLCVSVCDQVWLSWTMGYTLVGRCRWSGSKCTCRLTSSSQRKPRRSAHESWRHFMYKSTSLLWWGRICCQTHTSSYTPTPIVSHITSPHLTPDLSLSRLLTSSGASGHSSRPNTPPSILTSSGKFVCVWACFNCGVGKPGASYTCGVGQLCGDLSAGSHEFKWLRDKTWF